MPENEFEKKVSSEMQELKLKPSEKVWLQVEERIRRKKKRRVFIIIFLLAGLALLGYWQWNNLFDGKENSIVKAEPTTGKESKPVTEEKSKPNEPVNNKTEKTAEKKNIESKKKNEITIDQKDSKTNTIKLKQEQTTQTTKQETIKKKNITAKPVKPDKAGDLQTTSIESPEAKDIKADVVIRPNKDTLKNDNKQIETTNKEVRTDKEINETRVDSVEGNKELPKKEKVIPKDSNNKKEQDLKDSASTPKKYYASKKWKLSFEFTPGISSLNTNVFSFDMNKSADVFAFPSTGSNGGFPTTPARPSASSSGFAFQMGGLAKKQITPKISLAIGLRYGYYSEKINIGRDTLISYPFQSYSSITRPSYRASNSFQSKTNGYHFIELPVNYHLRLNKNKNKPFTLDAGLMISRLIATNAVMYDTAFGGVYYKNVKWLNKTQFSLNTGFSLTLINNRNIQWSLGPVIDLHLNSLLNSPFEDKKYLFATGLRSDIHFNSKK